MMKMMATLATLAEPQALSTIWVVLLVRGTNCMLPDVLGMRGHICWRPALCGELPHNIQHRVTEAVFRSESFLFQEH
jgi:hypothetical protein